MEFLTIDNLRTEFQKVIDDLNTINNFCMENEVSFFIRPRTSSAIISAQIYEWDKGFFLHKLKQTKTTELL